MNKEMEMRKMIKEMIKNELGFLFGLTIRLVGLAIGIAAVRLLVYFFTK